VLVIVIWNNSNNKETIANIDYEIGGILECERLKGLAGSGPYP
jgi:hypothetical protein